MTRWHSLYLCCADQSAVVSALHHTLATLDYQLFDPFGLIPGKTYPEAVRLFVAPPSGGWVRVIGVPDENLLPPLSQLGLCLSVGLDETEASIDGYADGKTVEREVALVPHLRPGCSESDLHRVLTQTYEATTGDDDLLLEMLPDDVQAMSGKVNKKQARRMFNRLSSNLMKKAGGDLDSSRQFLGESAVNWNSAGGQRIRAVMACLNVLENWREPDFITLRDAYQLHARRRRNPKAMLYPGDAEAMDSVPDALDYTPVYGGKNP
jgi:hypothetical protein